MGKPDGFLQWQRQMPERRPANERVGDWKELYEERSAALTKEQGGRCMDCGIPFCQQGCPLGNSIPDFNDHIYRDNWKAAWEVLRSTNNFPEFTGRLCPAPCEPACVLTINTSAVTIEQNEKEISERAWREGWVRPVRPRTRTGRRVAVVGSGPAGLAAAEQLNAAGHTVVVYERDAAVGGLLRYGIPDFKLEKDVIQRRVQVIEDAGVAFKTGVDVGQDISWSELQEAYDAVVVCIGAGRPRDLDVAGRELEGVAFAMDFLGHQNRVVSGEATQTPPELHAAGKRVVILGGGDTGSDCLGTSIRQGAIEVTQIELFPEPPQQRSDDNPWPQWPMVFRTSSSHEEGGARVFATMTTGLQGDGGKLTGLHTQRIEVVAEGDGRTRLVPVPGSEAVLPCDLLLLAMGFTGPVAASLHDQLGTPLDGRGNVATTHGFATSIPGLFVAGDARRGASLIVWAISEGREAARQTDAWLLGLPPRLPARGQDQPFGGR